MLLLTVHGVLHILAVSASAEDYEYRIDKDEEHRLYGNLNQNDIPGGGEHMCGPTAAVNSFMYLQRKYPGHFNSSLVGDADGNGTPDTYEDMKEAAETLAGPDYMNTKTNGTWGDMFISGKSKYMESVLLGKTVYGAELIHEWALEGKRPVDERPQIDKPDWVTDNTVPTWTFLWDRLSSCAAVEILINWDWNEEDEQYEGGHYLTIKSFFWNDVNRDNIIQREENATIDYIDPRTGEVKLSDIWFDPSFDTGGFHDGGLGIEYSYPDPEDPGLEITVDGQITMAMSQTLPEPATLLLLALGGMAMMRRRP